MLQCLGWVSKVERCFLVVVLRPRGMFQRPIVFVVASVVVKTTGGCVTSLVPDVVQTAFAKAFKINLVSLCLLDTRIVGALPNQQGGLDVVHVKKR